jgi:hypothetical protein
MAAPTVPTGPPTFGATAPPAPAFGATAPPAAFGSPPLTFGDVPFGASFGRTAQMYCLTSFIKDIDTELNKSLSKMMNDEIRMIALKYKKIQTNIEYNNMVEVVKKNGEAAQSSTVPTTNGENKRKRVADN